jgi:hypothetical protein
MDPNVQVAFVSVLVAIVTTSGVVVTALINRPRTKGPDSVQEDDGDRLDEKDVLERMLSLIAENERKELSMGRLRMTNAELVAENRLLKAENAQLILQLRDQGGP